MLQKYVAQLFPSSGVITASVPKAVPSSGAASPHPTNGRDFFRLALNEQPGTMQVIEVGGRPIKTDPREIALVDASGSGLAVLAQDELQIRRGVVAVFEFTLMEESFQFRGTLVRKVDDLKRFEYGVRFVDVDENQRDALISVLGRLQVQRHRGTRG